jgi:hypothetical protein
LISQLKGRAGIEAVWEEDAGANVCIYEKGSGSRRALHDEEAHNLYISPNMIIVIKFRGMRRRGAHSRPVHEELRNADNISVTRTDGRKSFGKPMNGWNDETESSDSRGVKLTQSPSGWGLNSNSC